MHFYEFIGIQKNAISLKDCNRIIDFFENNKSLHQHGCITNNQSVGNFDRVKIDFSVKKSIDICRDFNLNEEPENIILACIQKYMPIYENKFDSLKKIEQWQLCNNYNIRKYEPNMGYFAEHCEMHGVSVDGNRLMAWMVYLNDVSEGGETSFKYQDIKINPESGTFLVWLLIGRILIMVL